MTPKRWNMTLKKRKNFHIKHRKSVLLGFILNSSQSLLWKQEFHLSFCVRFPLFQMFHIRSVGKLPSTYIINPQIYLSVCLSVTPCISRTPWPMIGKFLLIIWKMRKIYSMSYSIYIRSFWKKTTNGGRTRLNNPHDQYQPSYVCNCAR